MVFFSLYCLCRLSASERARVCLCVGISVSFAHPLLKPHFMLPSANQPVNIFYQKAKGLTQKKKMYLFKFQTNRGKKTSKELQTTVWNIQLKWGKMKPSWQKLLVFCWCLNKPKKGERERERKWSKILLLSQFSEIKVKCIMFAQCCFVSHLVFHRIHKST